MVKKTQPGVWLINHRTCCGRPGLQHPGQASSARKEEAQLQPWACQVDKVGSTHPTPTSLMLLPERDTLSLERDHRSGGQHPKHSSKRIPATPSSKSFHGGLNLDSSMQTCIMGKKPRKVRDVYMSVGLWCYWHHRDIVEWFLWLDCWVGSIQAL